MAIYIEEGILQIIFIVVQSQLLLIYFHHSSAFEQGKRLCMRLCDLLGLTAAVASGISLDQVSEVEAEKIAQIVRDIHFEQHGKDLIFKEVTGQKAELTEEVLGTHSNMPAVVLFSFMYEDKVWSAEETDTGADMQALLDTKVDEKSYRYVILGANLITEEVQHYDIKLGYYRGTLLVELIPTC